MLRILGVETNVDADTVVYDVACLLSVVSILVAFSKNRLKRTLEDDALSGHLVTLCGLSLAYECKFRLGQQISFFRLARDYGHTLVAIAQTTHFVALAALLADAFCWLACAERRLRLGRGRGGLIASRIVCAFVVSSAIGVVCYLQFFRGQRTKIFLPKQLAQLLDVPAALLFFVALVFSRSRRPAACYRHRTTEVVLSVYIRTIVVTFAANCLHLILLMTKTEWTVVRLIGVFNGCFFALIACKLERLDVVSCSTWTLTSSLSLPPISVISAGATTSTLDITEPSPPVCDS